MNILYIVDTDPRRADYGGAQRIHSLWEGLKKLGDVFTVVPVTRIQYERRDDTEKIYQIQLERRYSIAWFVKRLTNRWNSHVPFPSLYTTRRLELYGIPSPDVCVVRPASLAVSLSLWERMLVIADMDDIPTVEVEMIERVKGSSLVLKIRKYLLQKMQEVVRRRARQIWIADEAEMHRFEGTAISYVPNIPFPPLPDFANELGSSDRLFFVGSLSTFPNVVALDWFLNDIWPEVHEKCPELKFEIAGGGLSSENKTAWSKIQGVKLLGRVDDLRPYYHNALAVVLPMRIGSGTCLKTVEALRMGRAILSTRQGLRGVREDDRTQENGMFVFENADEFLRQVDVLRRCDRVKFQRGGVAFVLKRNTQGFIDQAIRSSVLGVVDQK